MEGKGIVRTVLFSGHEFDQHNYYMNISGEISPGENPCCVAAFVSPLGNTNKFYG